MSNDPFAEDKEKQEAQIKDQEANADKTETNAKVSVKLTQDQKLMVEPWIAIFGEESIHKLFSKKFQEKEKGLQECEAVLKDSTKEKSRETLRVSCLIVHRAI